MATVEAVECIRRNSECLSALKAQLSSMQPNQDVLESVLSQIVVLPKELSVQIEDFTAKNRQFKIASREDFLKDAARWRLRYLSQEFEHVEVLREKFWQAETIIKEVGLPFLGVADYLEQQLDALIQKYEDSKKDEHSEIERLAKLKAP